MVKKRAHEVASFLACPSSKNYLVVLLYGPDRGLVSERATLFAKKSGMNLSSPFSTVYLDAADINRNPAILSHEALTFSLFDNGRLIWIRNGDAHKGLAHAIQGLLQKTHEKVFVLIEAGDLKKNTILRKTVEQNEKAVALPCYNDGAREINSLIKECLSTFQMSISQDAHEILQNHLGENRLTSRQELEKLCLYAKGKELISPEDVFEGVSNVSPRSQNEIIDAVISGNLPLFNQSFNRSLESKIPLFSILSAIQRQFQQLQEFRFTMDTTGKSASAIISEARHQIVLQRQPLMKQVILHWTSEDIIQAMKQLQNTLLNSRRNTELAKSIIRQSLITLTVQASKRKLHP
ncbi:MAG: DNA polymerase III subunit delta [Candidatus Tokpelaia sp. JSC161]|jgi:DNA polymerase-3 subunit delta|nr:MAG: DNA polymerase III subunit delta [Candidatus Tokpelaia sp. JSC161]